MSAASGMVRTQAQTMRPATPHLTAERRRVAPTPTMAPVMVCVVETGMPPKVTPMMAQRGGRLGAEAADGLELRDARAHRLHDAPAARERAEPDGRVADEHDPERDVVGRVRCRGSTATSTPAMMPIVFCASLPPWPRLKSAAETSCPLRKNLSTRCGDQRRKIHITATMMAKPSSRPDERREHDEDDRLRPARRGG